MSSDKICLFTDTGMMHTVRAKDVPLKKFREKGTPIDNLGNYSSENEQLILTAPMSEVKKQKLIFASLRGMTKVVDGSEFDVSKRTIAATKLSDPEDRLVFIGYAEQGEFMVLQSKDGFFIRFAISEIPEKKKGAVGVRGIRLEKKDEVEAGYLISSGNELQIEYGGRMLSLNHLKLSRRDGKGVKAKK